MALSNTELPDFNQLRKAAKKLAAGEELKVAVLCDSAPQFLADALRGTLTQYGMVGSVWEADIGQVDQQMQAPGSALWQWGPHYILVYEQEDSWREEYYREGSPKGYWKHALERVSHLAQRAEKNGAKLLYLNMIEKGDALYGQYGQRLEQSVEYQFKRFNVGLMEMAREQPALWPVDWNGLAAERGYQQAKNRAVAVQTDLQMSLDVLPTVADAVVKMIRAARGQVHKCLILDLDNTLWGGVVGDDGWERLALGKHGLGAPYRALQRWALELKKRGVLLAVASKNTEAIAREAFQKHPEMLLQEDDFAVFMANWDNKVLNIQRIREVLNIGFDALVFVDDNPFEREMVRQQLPAVAVPEMPEDPAEYLPYLQRLNLFETASLSALDARRTEQYQREAQRVSEKGRYADEAAFLESLQMRARVEGLNAYNLPRAAQLTQRSNQFNLRTQRYTEAELQEWARQPGHAIFNFYLTDRFGDHGLIAVLMLEKMDSDTYFIHNWLMSCRVLKRGMEAFTLNYLADWARRQGVQKLKGERIPTAKNVLVEGLLPSLGFEKLQAAGWQLTLGAFTPLKTPIKTNDPHENT